MAAWRSGTVLPDPNFDAVARFTAAMVEIRVAPAKRRSMISSLRALPRSSLAVVLAVACKLYSNMVNHLAGTELDAHFQPYAMTTDA